MSIKVSSTAATIFVAIIGLIVIYFVVCSQSVDDTKDYVLSNVKGLLVIFQTIAICVLLLLKKWWAAAFLGFTVLLTVLGVKS